MAPTAFHHGRMMAVAQIRQWWCQIQSEDVSYEFKSNDFSYNTPLVETNKIAFAWDGFNVSAKSCKLDENEILLKQGTLKSDTEALQIDFNKVQVEVNLKQFSNKRKIEKLELNAKSIAYNSNSNLQLSSDIDLSFKNIKVIALQ